MHVRLAASCDWHPAVSRRVSLCHPVNDVVVISRRRYYTNDTFYSGNGLVFIEIGGEGPLTSYPTGFIAQLAKQHGAYLVSLEHRFYGGMAGDLVPILLAVGGNFIVWYTVMCGFLGQMREFV